MRSELGRADIEPENLPLVAVLNQAERDCGFPLFKRSLRGVLSRNNLACLGGRGHESLSLCWLRLLKAAKDCQTSGTSGLAAAVWRPS